jgi:thioredoxin reductase
MSQPHDVIIIGGSFAGLSAAMQLGRARRDVLIIDAGENRNRFAHAAHGLLGHDGKSPAEILAAARAELGRYPTVQFRPGRATSASQTPDGFTVGLDSGETASARRLILAIGVTDTLPAIPGIRERWGTSVFHCPYCHGFEVAGRQLGVIATSEMSAHQAQLLTDWSDSITLFTNGHTIEIDDPRVRLESRTVAAVEDDGVRLADGSLIPVEGIFLGPSTAPTGDIAHQLGCEVQETPLGHMLVVNQLMETSVPHVYAAGDVTKMASNLAGAIADGAMAGVAAHRSLVFEPAAV